MRNKNIIKKVQIAMLIALVVVLQTVGTFVKVGAFSLSLVLIPIVVGGHLFGSKSGALLGAAFGVMALIYSISASDASESYLCLCLEGRTSEEHVYAFSCLNASCS